MAEEKDMQGIETVMYMPNEDNNITGVSLGEISLTDEEIDGGLTITLDNGDNELDADFALNDSESIIDSYINSLEESKETTLTDVAIEQLGEEGNKANIFAAGLQIDISSGEKFDADKMVKDRIDMENNKSNIVISDLDTPDYIEDPTAVKPNFTAKELEGLAKILTNTKCNDKIRELRASEARLKAELKKMIDEEGEIERKYSILTPYVKELANNRALLTGALVDLQGLDAGKDTSANLRPKVQQGISAMHVQENLDRVNAEIVKAEQSFRELQARGKELNEEQMRVVSERRAVQKEIEQVISTSDIADSLTEVKDKYHKIVAVEFGNKKLSEDFKEAPVFIKCQCGGISKFDFSAMPKYVGIKVTEYADYKGKLQSYSREMMNNLVLPGLTDNGPSKLVCKECSKDMMFTPTILQDFVKSAFANEVHAIEKHSKSNSTSNVPEDYQDSAVYYLLSEANFSSEYLKDLGFMQYYESKATTINTDPLLDVGTNLTLGEKEERIVRMFNPEVPEEMYNASMKSFNNLINSVNVFLDIVHKEKLKIKQNATTKSAIEKNRINRKMANFIVEQRWLLVSYCVNKQIPIQAFKERLDNAYKSVVGINKFQYELFDFFVEHVVNSIVEGRDIVYVDSSRNTKLLEVKKRSLPHQTFFNRYRRLVTVYFKIRSKQIKSLAQLEVFQEVLSGVNEINKIEGEDLATQKSEEIVRNVLKDIDDLIENGLAKNYALRQQLIVLYGKTTEKNINYLIDNNKGQYEDGSFYAWIAFEARNNLLNSKTIATNEELYSKLYGTN